MHTFYQIIQYLFNNNAPITYLDGTFEQSSEYMRSIYEERIKSQDAPKLGVVKQFFFMHMLTNKYSVITKFALLKEVFENIFSNKDTQEEFLGYFSKMQRIYFLLVKHAYRYKMRKSSVQVSTDVFMTPLREGDSKTLAIVQYGKKYLFSTSDLINIINSSLSNTSYFFAEPLVCKNPYNNIPFNKSTLYNMYFFIKKSSFLLPILFHYYFMENFNLKRFSEKHETLIREKSIKRHVEKSGVNELYEEIITILHVNRYTRKLHIDDHFPKDRLVNIMRPYLQLYYSYTCSTDLVKRDAYEKEFNEKMMNFYLYNKQFGRKYYKREMTTTNPFIRNRKHKYIISFNDDHLKFHNADEELRDFKYSHIHISKLNDDEDDDEEESVTDVDE